VTWLDRAKRLVGDAARSVVAEAQIVKLQAELGRVEAERERQFAEAGRRAQELYRARRVVDDELGVILKRIDQLDAHLQELRREVERLRASQAAGTGTTESDHAGGNK
jgi:uncharacterized small protein (DUF1192 family)